MIVEYEVTKADILRFWWHHIRTAPYVRWSLLGGIAVSTILTGVMALVRWPDRPAVALWTAITTPLLFIAIGLVAGPPLIWLLVQFLLREGSNRGVIGRHRIVLDDQDVREDTDHGSQNVRWTAVHRVDQNALYLYIYIQPGAAHVVPKRAFQSDGDAVAFFARAHQLWSSASGRTGSVS